MHRFYAPPGDLADGEITLGVDETRHLRDVLRLRVGNEVSVFDGCGCEHACAIRTIGKKASTLTIIREVTPAAPESVFEINIAAAMLKGDKFDLVVQKAVELGVASIVPLHTIRCDVRLDGRAKRLERWRRIALEATKQCGRARLMSIVEPVPFAGMIAGSGDNGLMMFSERQGETFPAGERLKNVTAIFGPEGGWDDSELELARSHGVKIVTLGGRILRAETAIIAISAILQDRFGDLI